MKSVKVFLPGLLFLWASWTWSAEIHDAALKGDLARANS